MFNMAYPLENRLKQTKILSTGLIERVYRESLLNYWFLSGTAE